MSAPITLVGRLVADPELTFVSSGTAKVALRVVTSTRYKDGDEWKDKDTTFWNVTIWRQAAENVAESLTKGDAVVVVGKMKSREYETAQGEKRTAWEVDASAVARVRSAATAKVSKVTREGAGRAQYDAARASDDPWASPASDTTYAPVPF
jgi:single-strand DNA-binding protein